MTTNPVTRAWVTLLGLSGASTLVAALVSIGFGRTAIGAVILFLAWAKARVILSRYLGLWQAPFWMAGFNWALALFCLLLLGLFLAPVIMA